LSAPLHDRPSDAPPHLVFLATKIIETVRISDVAALKIALKKRGRRFYGISPFAPERHPNFFIDDDVGFYHCATTRRRGDIVRFVMETEALGYEAAVMRLAAFLGRRAPL
jgi:DNA primase